MGFTGVLKDESIVPGLLIVPVSEVSLEERELLPQTTKPIIWSDLVKQDETQKTETSSSSLDPSNPQIHTLFSAFLNSPELKKALSQIPAQKQEPPLLPTPQKIPALKQEHLLPTPSSSSPKPIQIQLPAVPTSNPFQVLSNLSSSSSDSQF